MIRSGVTDYKSSFVLSQDWSPNFPLRLMLKDIHLMLEAARRRKSNCPRCRRSRRFTRRPWQPGTPMTTLPSTVETVRNL